MNRNHSIGLSVFLVILCAAAPWAIVSAADFQARSVEKEVTIDHPDLQVRDVTDRYTADPAGGRRADGEHRFINVAGTATGQGTREVVLTSDGGAVVAGVHYNDQNNSEDCLLLKYDDMGALLWARTFGDEGTEYFRGVGETPDGGYVAAGYSNSYGSGDLDLLLVKFSSSGAVQWARTAGEDLSDGADAMCIAADGTIAIAGLTSNYGAVDTDILMMGFDGTGTLLWCTVAGAPSNDRLFSIRPTSDGGYIGTGWTVVTGDMQVILVKFDATGAITWRSTVGDFGFNVGYDAVETPDGGYLLTGITSAYDPYGTYDVILARFGANGTLYWARSVGVGNAREVGYSLAVRDDGGFTIAGVTDSHPSSTGNGMLLSFDSAGGLQWARQFGSDQADYFRSLVDLPDGGFLVAGGTENFGAGDYDMLFAKLDENGLVPGCQYTRTWNITAPLRTPTWSAVTLTEASPTPTVNALTLTTTDPMLQEETVCQYQEPETEYWLVASGRDDTDRGKAIGRTPDGGYLVATETTVGAANDDVLLIKYDALGNPQWARETGGPYYDQPRDLLVTDDGGCVVVGSTLSYGAGAMDALIMGFDPGGNVLWTTVLGGVETEWIYSIHQRSDGNYLVVGSTNSYGAGLFDLLAIEVTPTGTVPSVRVLGTAANEVAYRGIPLSGGGSLLAGFSNSSGGNQDALAVRMGDDGSFTWCARSGTSGLEQFYGIAELPGGDLMLGGVTNSYGSTDILLVRLNSDGFQQWFRVTGTEYEEYLLDLKSTSDGSVVGCGYITQSVTGYFDALLCSFDDQAQPLWARRVAGTTSEEFDSLVVNEDGGYAAAGFTSSFGLATWEALVTRTDSQGMVDDCPYFSTVTFTTSDQYPPSGSYTMTSSAISPSLTTPFMEHWGIEPSHLELCRALPPTVSAFITSLPSVGTVPFSTWMEVTLTNNYDEQIRRIAAHIDLTLGSGSYYPNWRTGFTNIVPGANYVTGWPQNIPAMVKVLGENHFRLVAEDVTPSPYNLPPYPPAGDTDTGLQIVTAYAP